MLGWLERKYVVRALEKIYVCPWSYILEVAHISCRVCVKAKGKFILVRLAI